VPPADVQEAGGQMRSAWARIKRTERRLFTDYIVVGEGLVAGRQWAMRVARTDRPEGAAYQAAFGEFLQRYGVHDLDKSDRKRLFDIIDELPAITEWRNAL